MADLTIPAQLRTEFGKGAARRIRRADRIPAVIYGHGTDPVHISLPGHETFLALKHVNALLTIDVEGRPQLALARDVQRDPVKNVIEHVDLVVVRRGEKVTVDIPVHITGETAPDTLVNLEQQTLELEVAATDIPELLEVSVEGLRVGAQVTAADITLPAGASLSIEPETVVVHVSAAPTAEEVEAELAEAEGEAGIEREEPEAEAQAGAEPETAESEAGDRE